MANNIIESLKWRYAIKKFDANKKVNESELNELLESLRLAPTSYGLQPLKFIVVTNKELREKLKSASWNQSQIADASHLIVFCARTDLDEKYAKEYIKLIAQTRKLPVESLKSFEDILIGFIKNMSQEQLVAWAKKQVYIALGILVETAAVMKIDACPMEGFNAEKYDEILNLKKQNLTSVVLCPIGYRSSDDGYAKAEKVRFPKESLVLFEK